MFNGEPEKVEIFYICDRKACEECSCPECEHTSDIDHAVNKCDMDGRSFVYRIGPESIGFFEADLSHIALGGE